MKPQGFPEGLIRRGWRSFLPELSLRSAALVALVALGGLSLSALAVFALGGAPGARAQPATTIDVGDFWFCDSSFEGTDCQTTINEGATVTWNFIQGTGDDAHTTTSDTGVWDSGQVDAPGTFSLMFDTPGTFLYRCDTHPLVMGGSIIVLAAAEPSPSPQPSPEGSPEVSPQPSPPSATPTPVDIQPSTVPDGGGAPAAEGGTSMLWWLTIAAGGFLMALASLLALRLRR